MLILKKKMTQADAERVALELVGSLQKLGYMGSGVPDVGGAANTIRITWEIAQAIVYKPNPRKKKKNVAAQK